MDRKSAPTPTELHQRMTVDASRFQARKFLSALEEYEGLKEACHEGESLTPDYLPLLSDTFSSFFQTQANLKPGAPEGLEENRAVMSTVLDLKEYKELHTVSKLDFFASAAATRAFSEKLTELIKDKQTRDKQKPQRNQRGDQGKTPDQEENPAAGALGVDEDTLRWAARAALKKGLDEAQEAKQAIECFGRERGGLQNISVTEQFRLADLLNKNPKIREIIRLLGRMKLEALSAKRTRITPAPPVRRGVEAAGIEAIDRALPEELLDPALGETGAKRFYKKLAEEEVLVHGYRTPQTETKGPILVAIDSSGSMEGEREIWARAMALASFLQGKKEKREAKAVIFGAADELVEVELHETEKLASAAFHAGTDYVTPLNWIMHELHQNPRADVLFITDGICNLPHDFTETFIGTKQHTGAKCLSILIESQSTHAVKRFSDKVFTLSGTPTAKDGGEILAEL